MDPRRLLPALTAVACALVVATVVVTLARPGPMPPDPVLPDEVGAVGRSSPAAVLAAWDARRARAWAEADVRGLARLYVEGSRAGRADVRLLRHYRERGLRVEGLTTQVLALEVVERGPRRLELVVTDRVVGGEAVGGATAVALPGDRASTREVVLVRGAGGAWQVVEAREAGAQASPAASTSRTSSSSKS
ncbi:hypothetical protein F4692_003825 [Nocardioides cavernae]|uniref:Uncharacterized protein n=1 Tax=Nocardioides cavernae TaxID=1921566 RepID=A0A7Y9H6A6_9ACTN|nr:hypothetical protein [Nocardioides cavernae]NYE38675.1 hypothetical protein [Nocardioides cavernae]